MGGSASKVQLVSGEGKVLTTVSEARLPLGEQRIDKPRIAFASVPGFGKDEEENEDFVATGELSNGLFYCAIFDGHGQHGRAVSEACALEVPKVLKTRCTGDAEQDMEKAIISAFSDLHTSIAALDGAVAEFSGAVCTLALYEPKSRVLYVGNVGNAKALASGQKGMEQMTVDHYCTVEEEKNRIVAAGGRVDASDDIQLGTLGEVRIWKGNTVLHTVSRAIGDLHGKTVGMLHTPSVRRIDVGDRFRFLVMCSSGVWKVMDPEGCSQLVEDLMHTSTDLQPLVDEILEQAAERWAELWQGENTSSLVLMFPTAH
jgi:serine/threonine protein phosphatase PrpC